MIEDIKEFVQINKAAVAGLAIIVCIFLITRFTSVLGGNKSSKKLDLSADSGDIDALIAEIHELQGI